MARDLDDPASRRLLAAQDDVVSRRQLCELGARPHDLERLLRGPLHLVHPGVYVAHNGPLTSRQRDWAAVLCHAPAALTGPSALPPQLAPSTGPVHVAVDARRTVRAVPGVLVHRTHDLAARVHPASRPPRVRLEHVAIDLASRAVADGRTDLAFSLLAEVCGTRHTHPEVCRRVLAGRHRVSGRRVIDALLTDLSTGLGSFLERQYLVAVARPHGLPPADHQVPGPRTADGRRTYRDLRHAAYGVVVELDGRATHGSVTAWEADHERDLAAAAASGEVTLRLSHGQVLGRPCLTATRVGLVLARRGWEGSVLPGPCCSSATLTAGA